MKSIVRLMQRSSEVLPDWAGPMIAEDLVAANVEGDAVKDLLAAVGEPEILDLDLGSWRHAQRRYHFLRERRKTRSAMAVALTSSTEPSSTTAVA